MLWEACVKILQTGDLHLGKILYEYSLLDDQKYILQQLHNELCSANEPYDVLLLTGDIYDRAVPPPDAVDLFDTFLSNLHKTLPNLHIFIIGGNHDSIRRLSFGSSLFETSNIHIAKDISQSFTDESSISDMLEKNIIPVILTDKNHEATLKSGNTTRKSDENCDITNYSDVKFVFWQLSFMSANRLTEAISFINNKILSSDGNTYHILSAHCLTFGAITSESERTFLGTAENIDSSIFKNFTYTAIGHIHKPQKITDTVYYAGSPLAYSFSEADTQKSFLRITINAPETSLTESTATTSNASLTESTATTSNASLPESTATTSPKNTITPVIENIEIKHLRRLVTLKASLADLLNSTEFSEYENDYVELIATDKALLDQPVAQLKKRYPYFMNFRIDDSKTQNTNSTQAASLEIRRKMLEQKENISLTKTFESFISDVYGVSDEWSEEANLFEEIAKEYNNTLRETAEN